MARAKRLRGQPTTYREEYCDALVKHMAEGFSFETFAATIDTHRDTLYNWCKLFPDFSDAKKEGMDKSQVYFEKLGKAAMLGKIDGFSSAVWIFSMKNRFRWQDKVEISGGDETKPLVLAYKS